MPFKKINIGDRWVTAVKSSTTDTELFRVYKSGLPAVVKLFDNFVKRNDLKKVAVADFGGAIGDVTHFLKKHSRLKIRKNFTCIDLDRDLLKQNKSCNEKVCADLKTFSEKDKYDVGIMRYVLNYNSKETQLKILKNVHDSLKSKSIFINYWCGVSNRIHQSKFQTLFGTQKVNKNFFRPNSYWTTWKENEVLFKKAGFTVKVAKKFSIPIKHLYKIRYGINDEENKRILKYLGKYGFISYVIFSAFKISRQRKT